MAQMTVYLDDEVLALVNRAVQAAGVSKSHWVADAIRARARQEWPESVRSLAGAWPDFPTLEEIRRSTSADAPREEL
jgi:hypothetical protein